MTIAVGDKVLHISPPGSPDEQKISSNQPAEMTVTAIDDSNMATCTFEGQQPGEVYIFPVYQLTPAEDAAPPAKASAHAVSPKK